VNPVRRFCAGFRVHHLRSDNSTGESWVPESSPPPLALAKAFSRSGCVRIFPLFSRVMRVRLSTGPRTWRPKAVSQGRYSLELMTAPISVNSRKPLGSMDISLPIPSRCSRCRSLIGRNPDRTKVTGSRGSRCTAGGQKERASESGADRSRPDNDDQSVLGSTLTTESRI
jgi:hypothetical protein